MKKVYFISGLGADKRIFSNLDLSFCEPVFINWIKPFQKESLENYAYRLSEQIPEINPTIVGMSFGGMLLTEMAKNNPGIKGILISSNKTSIEFPFYWRIAKYFPIYKWVPASLSKNTALITSFMIGGRNQVQKKLLHQIIRESDINFVKWAIDAILHWKNKTIPSNIIHIHGTADKLLPYRLVKANYSIKEGSHVMTLDKAEELSELLRKLIK